MKFPLTSTLEEIKEYLKENWLKGSSCPACGQHVQLYKLKISGQAVRDLIRLYKLSEGQVNEYHHINDFGNLASRSFSKLAHWGLIEDEPNEDEAKRTSGMWAMTEKGRRFVAKELEVPKYAYIYNSQCKTVSPETVGVEEALGHKFNYKELMGFSS